MGVIGGGNVSLWDSITRLGGTEIICCHHEQAAAMASSYFNRIHGGIGSIALVTTGGGSTNAITGVVASYMDRAPLFVISGNEASHYMTSKLRVKGVQGYDSSKAAEPFCKKSSRIRNEDEWHSKLESAWKAALARPQGPVWVDIPKDVQGVRL
jgi:acetolactate synthase-1/2/3 large subunit